MLKIDEHKAIDVAAKLTQKWGWMPPDDDYHHRLGIAYEDVLFVLDNYHGNVENKNGQEG